MYLYDTGQLCLRKEAAPESGGSAGGGGRVEEGCVRMYNDFPCL